MHIILEVSWPGTLTTAPARRRARPPPRRSRRALAVIHSEAMWWTLPLISSGGATAFTFRLYKFTCKHFIPVHCGVFSNDKYGLVGNPLFVPLLVTEAISRTDWFARWGRHYLPSLQRAHELQQSACLLYTSPSPRDMRRSRMPSSA